MTKPDQNKPTDKIKKRSGTPAAKRLIAEAGTEALEESQERKELKKKSNGAKYSLSELDRQEKIIDPLQKTKLRAKDQKTGELVDYVGGTDKLKHDGEILQLEWAIKFPMLSPKDFLLIEKVYSVVQTNDILHQTGGESEWQLKRAEIQNKLTETVVKRHIDQMAEVQELHVRASKLSLMKAIDMINRMQVEPYKDSDGKLVVDPTTKKPIYRGFRSIDLLNCTSSIEKAQQIYRRAMGIPNEHNGIAQIMEQINAQKVQHNSVEINNINLTVNPKKAEAEKKLEDFMEQLEYDDLREFVEYRRQQQNKKEVIDAESTTVSDESETDT